MTRSRLVGLLVLTSLLLVLRPAREHSILLASVRGDVLKRPGKLAPSDGTGKVVDISKFLEHEEEEEEGGEPKADPDLAPGAAPTPDPAMADRFLPGVETPDIPPPPPYAASTFTVGRTTTLAPTYSSSVSEPSLGSQGNGIFVTNNWGAARSTDNGSNWSYIDPFSKFPDTGTGFTAGVCCDQRVIQDPSRDLIIWLLQYDKTGSTSTDLNGMRIAVTNGASGLSSNTWTYHDITPTDFGMTGKWLDYPTLQVSSNYLYVTSNVYTTTSNTFSAAVIARIPLANLANNTSYTMNTYTTSSFGSITPVSGASSTMYFGARFGTTSIKVLTWAEADSSPTETTVSGLNTIYSSSFTCTTPDGLNPCGRADTRMQTAWLTSTELGFMWHSSQGGTYAYPWTKVAILNPSTLAIQSQPEIYSSDSAWLYPALAVNGRGDLGGIIDRLGGSAAYPQVRGLIRDDYSPDVTTNGWETYTLSTSTHGTSSRWGDYNGAVAHEKYPNTWLIAGHMQSGGSGDTNTGNNHSKVMNYSIYRAEDDPSLPMLSIGDVTVTEGDSGTSNATFTVSMSSSSASTVTVSAVTSAGTATSGTDFTATGPTTLSFSAGTTSKTFTVPIKGDTIDEDDETFSVTLSSATNASILDSTATGTITDNDAAPSLSINDVTVTEGNSGSTSAIFTVSLSAASAKSITVSAATANNTAISGSDYTATGPNTLTFSAGTTSQTFTVPVLGDTTDETNETYVVNLTSATNATISDNQATGTITDDDAAPTISITDVTVTEGNSGSANASFTVSLSAASGQTVTVSAVTANNSASSGSDYTTTGPTTLTFSAGTTTQTFAVPVLGDTLDEDDETFLVNLTSATNATILDTQGIGTITDNDASPTLSINDVTVTEGNSGTVSASFTVTLSTASGRTVTVAAQTANSSATSGTDYTAVGATTLSFAAGTTSKTFAVSVLGDTLDEANETYAVNLTSPTNASTSDALGVGTITDDDAAPNMTINDVTVTEGNSGTTNAIFTVTLSTTSGQTVTVSALTANSTATSGADYTTTGPTTLSIAAGLTSQTFTVPVLGDTTDEVNETFAVNLTSGSNVTVTDSVGIGTITDDDAAPTVSINDVTVTEGNSGSVSASFTVSLSAASGQSVTVSALTANDTALSSFDYTATGASTLTFSAGTTSQTFSVPVLGDTLDEANETFFVNLTSPSNATISDSQGLGTITDDDASPALSISDATVTEGNSGTVTATFTVSLSAVSGQGVTVVAQAADNSAVAPADYTAAGPTTLTFAAGATTQSFAVTVAGDVLDEANETFFVNLTAAVNASVSDAQGLGTVTDDDASPTISISDATVTEGNSGNTSATFTATLSTASGQVVTVSAQTADGTAVAGADYTATGPSTITFAAGSTSQTITIPVLGDASDEVDETFAVNLTSATNAGITDAQGVGTITDDDAPPSLSINDISVSEGNSGSSTATFTVALSVASGKTITVSAQTADGTAIAGSDYTAAGPTTVTIAAGASSQSFTVPILGDTLDEANETLLVNLTSPSNATISDSQGIGTITDDDASPALSISDATVTEGNSGTVTATFTVTLSAASAQAVTVSAQTADSSATAPSDYSAAGPTTLTFAAGVTTQSFAVAVAGDALNEANETFFVNLTSAVNASIADAQGLGTITDDDASPSISTSDAAVTEGHSGPTNATFTVTLSAPSGQVVTVSALTADATAAAGSDYTTTGPATITFPVGSTSQTIAVPVLGDASDEVDETFVLNLTSATNAGIADAQGVGTITDDDDPPSLSIGDVSLAEGNSGASNATFTVTVSVASGKAISVSAQTADSTATAGSDYTATGPTTLTFAAGVTTQTFNVPVLGDGLDEPDETFAVNLSGAANASILGSQGVGTITDDDGAPSISINDVTITEGNSGSTSAVFTATLSAASAQVVTVSAQTAAGTAAAGSDFTSTGPTTLTFAAGATSQTFAVPVLGDTTFEGNETFLVNLTSAVNATISDSQGIGTISDDEPALSISIADAALAEGNSGSSVLTFTATLSGPSTSTVTVSARTADATALSGSDYTATGPTTLTFAAGSTTQTFAVPVLGDTLDEVAETFVVNLTSATNATIADAQAVGTITDDDPTPTLSIADIAVTEGNSGSASATFTISLSAASAQSITVTAQTAPNTALAGSDFTSTGPTVLTFAPGDVTKSFVVPILGDVVVESTESFFVNLTLPTNATIADSQATATITDNDASVPTASITSPAASATLSGTQTISATASGTSVISSVEFYVDAVFQGSDTSSPYTYSWDTRKVVNGSHSLTVKAKTAAGGVGTSAARSVTIANTGTALPTLSIADASIGEGHSGSALMAFTLTLSAASASDVTVSYATSDLTAAAGSDYTAATGSITIGAGLTTKNVVVLVTSDTNVETDETFTIALTNPTNSAIGTARATGTITNDDPANTATVVTQYRLYHDGTKEHLYTTDFNEYNVLGTRGWVKEGVAYKMLTSGIYNGVATVPLFRLYHPGILQHMWTTDSNEGVVLGGTAAWSYESTIGYMLPVQVAGTVPLYRLALASPAIHLWTTDKNEYDTLATFGWTQEGIVGYVVP
jgi:ribosomal protein L35AE/L33A